MRNLLISLLAIIAFLIGGYLLYFAAMEEQKVSSTLEFPKMIVPSGVEVHTPIELDDSFPEQESVSVGTVRAKKYVSKDLEECAVVRFVCEEGYDYFIDDDGCGCAMVLY